MITVPHIKYYIKNKNESNILHLLPLCAHVIK